MNKSGKAWEISVRRKSIRVSIMHGNQWRHIDVQSDDAKKMAKQITTLANAIEEAYDG